MGNFRIEINAVGGHGYAREVGDGQELKEPPVEHVDRAIWEAVEWLRQRGCTIDSAALTHWPGTEVQVVDDLVAGVRRGSFSS